MSGFITNAGENYLLDLLTGRVQPLSNYYLALIGSRPPSKFISGDQLDEPNSADYARAQYANSSLWWTASAGEIHNTQRASFPVATTDWGTCKFWAVCTAAGGGDVLWAGPITIPLVVYVGDQVLLEPGTITLRLTSYAARVSL